MRNLLVKIGKEFASNKWGVSFSNTANTFNVECEEGFGVTVPFPGSIITEEEIKTFISFLQQTLEEKEDHEQSNME